MNEILSDLKTVTAYHRDYMGRKYTIVSKYAGRLYEAVLDSIVSPSIGKFTQGMKGKNVNTKFHFDCHEDKFVPVIYASSEKEADILAKEAIAAYNSIQSTNSVHPY